MTLDEVRLAGSGAAAPVRRAGEEGLGEMVGAARLAQAGDGGVERAGGLRAAECVLRAADQQVAEADVVRGPGPGRDSARQCRADSGRAQALAPRRRGRGSGRRTGSPGGSRAGRRSGSSLPRISSASANSAAARPKSPAAVRAAARCARRNSRCASSPLRSAWVTACPATSTASPARPSVSSVSVSSPPCAQRSVQSLLSNICFEAGPPRLDRIAQAPQSRQRERCGTEQPRLIVRFKLAARRPPRRFEEMSHAPQ